MKQLALPGAAFPDLSGPVVRMLRRRVLNETARTMRRHPDGRRHALYALFLAHRERELTDGLVEVVHKVGSQAKKRVIKAFNDEIERVHGKEGLLVKIAEAACLQPEGIVRSACSARLTARGTTINQGLAALFS